MRASECTTIKNLKTDLYDATSLTICLNSLTKIDALGDDELANYIVYIDEIASFLEFTGNDTLDSVLKRVQVVLMRIVRYAGKIIVSDALINDNVFEFLKHRDIKTTIVLKNNYQKFKDVPAVRIRDETNFLNKLLDHCRDEQPFIFGSDSCDVITKFFHKCRESAPDQHDKFLLIIADTNVRVKDASTEWKNKYVFFSPKITFGVDFSVAESQDMFIYIKGGRILPSGCFQQATRCMNIRTLYYFGECSEDNSRYTSLEDVKHNVEHCLEASNLLNNLCTYLDENDELKFAHNTFFNLYCYNLYVADLYNSNRIKHFELILAEGGFNLSVEGVAREVLSKVERNAMRDVVDDIANKLYDECRASNCKSDPKFQIIMKNLEYLKVNPNDVEALTKYRDIILNKYRIKEHDAIIRLLKTKEHIKAQLDDLRFKSIDVKVLTNPYHQMKLLRELEEQYGMTIYNINQKFEGEFTMDDAKFKLIKHMFNSVRRKPESFTGYKMMYASLVKSITCKDIMQSKRSKAKADRDVMNYILDSNLIQTHLELNGLKNQRRRGFSSDAVQTFGITPIEADAEFLD